GATRARRVRALEAARGSLARGVLGGALGDRAVGAARRGRSAARAVPGDVPAARPDMAALGRAPDQGPPARRPSGPGRSARPRPRSPAALSDRPEDGGPPTRTRGRRSVLLARDDA